MPYPQQTSEFFYQLLEVDNTRYARVGGPFPDVESALAEGEHWRAFLGMRDLVLRIFKRREGRIVNVETGQEKLLPSVWILRISKDLDGVPIATEETVYNDFLLNWDKELRSELLTECERDFIIDEVSGECRWCLQFARATNSEQGA